MNFFSHPPSVSLWFLDQIKTSTKIIPSTTDFIPGSSKRTFTVNGNWMSSEPITEKSTTMEHETTQLTFNAPIKPVRERVYSKLPQQFAKIRGKYFRTNFTHQLQYASIDRKEYFSKIHVQCFVSI